MTISTFYKTKNIWFMNFAKDSRFQLPIDRKESDDYIESLMNLYKNYLQYIKSGPIERKLKEDAMKLCELILKVFNSVDDEVRNDTMDELIKNYIDKPSPHDVLCYSKKNITGMNMMIYFILKIGL